MPDYLSYITGNTLISDEFKNAEKTAKKTLLNLNSDTLKNEFNNAFLGSNKTKQGSLGQFHTPDEIVNVVLDCLPKGFEKTLIQGSTLVDSSCGTGNFLVEVVKRVLGILEKSGCSDPYDFINKNVIPNLYGFEIDKLLTQAMEKLFKFEFDGKIHCPKIIVSDSLDPKVKTLKKYLGYFDFVVGNPPWVEVKNLPDLAKKMVQSTYKVSNLYGAFILRGSEFLKEEGCLSYVVPRSFTGGLYYTHLRTELKNKFTLINISYYSNRKQNFQGGKVLQEMVVFSFLKLKPNNNQVTCIPCHDFSDFNASSGFKVKQSDLFSCHNLIMLLADSKKDFSWLRSISSHKNFEEHGFRLSTGQMVTHRCRDFLRDEKTSDASRILYPHDVIQNENDTLNFMKRPKPHKTKKTYAVNEGIPNLDGRNKDKQVEKKTISIQNYCNTFREIIIFRRRSHKGDKRRFVGIYIDNGLPNTYFLDNGLNFIVSENKAPGAPSLKAFSRILRSDVFEKFFEMISSNTQINKNDMYLFGLPLVSSKNKKIYNKIENTSFNDLANLTSLVELLYSVSQDPT